MTVTMPHKALAAEDYWTADQLRVMRGLELPAWFRPVVHEQASMASTVEKVASVETTAPIATTKGVEAVKAVEHAQQVAKPLQLEDIQQPKQQPKANIVQQHYPWLVVVSQTLSADAQRLWGNMLASVGKNDSTAYVLALPTDAVLNNDPFSDSAQAALAHIQAQMAAMQTKLVITMGELASQILLGVDSDLLSMQGELHELDGLPVLVMQHPKDVLLTPQLKAQAWRELNLI
jgi:uracil-DNA glycosylase family 4